MFCAYVADFSPATGGMGTFVHLHGWFKLFWGIEIRSALLNIIDACPIELEPRA